MGLLEPLGEAESEESSAGAKCRLESGFENVAASANVCTQHKLQAARCSTC